MGKVLKPKEKKKDDRCNPRCEETGVQCGDFTRTDGMLLLMEDKGLTPKRGSAMLASFSLVIQKEKQPPCAD